MNDPRCGRRRTARCWIPARPFAGTICIYCGDVRPDMPWWLYWLWLPLTMVAWDGTVRVEDGD